jgi:hypothetical protein
MKELFQVYKQHPEGEDQGILWAKLKHKGYDTLVVLYRMLNPYEIKTLCYRKLSGWVRMRTCI